MNRSTLQCVNDMKTNIKISLICLGSVGDCQCRLPGFTAACEEAGEEEGRARLAAFNNNKTTFCIMIERSDIG